VISLRSRTWWRNLRGERIAQLHHAGVTFPVRAKVVETPGEVAVWLEKYFVQYPSYAKYFEIRPGPDGKPTTRDLERVAEERVILRLFSA